MRRVRKWTKELITREVKRLHRKLKRRPTKRDDFSLYLASRKLFGSWNNMMEKGGYKVKRNQTAKIPKLSSDLFYLLGLLVTDGHIQYIRGEKYSVLFFTSHKEEKEMLVSLIEKLFDYKPLIRAKLYGWNKLTSFELHISSKQLTEFLHEKFDIPYGNKSGNIRVPRIIFKRSDRDIENFLRGVIDGDGGISITSFKLTISSKSKSFLYDLKRLSKNIGILFRGPKISNGNVWEIGVYNKIGLEKIYQIYNSKYFYSRNKLTLSNLFKNKAHKNFIPRVAQIPKMEE